MIARDTFVIRTIQIGLFVALFGAWYLGTRADDTPLSCFCRRRSWSGARWACCCETGRLWSALYVTIMSIVQAYAIAVVAGIAVGFVVARSRTLVQMFEPVLSGMFAVPLTMFFPLFVLFFGIGPESKVAYGATYAFFPIALNTIAAFSNVDELYLRAVARDGRVGVAAVPLRLSAGGAAGDAHGHAHRLLHLHRLGAGRRDARRHRRRRPLDRARGRVDGDRAALCLDRLRGLHVGDAQPARARGRDAQRAGVNGMSAHAIRMTRLLLILGVLLLWELYARVFATSSLTAAPSQVLAELWPKVLGEPRVRAAIGVTLIEMVVAFVMSVVFGMLIGVLVGLTDIGRRSFYPIVLLLYGIPQAILLPLFVLMFGLGPGEQDRLRLQPRRVPGDRQHHRRHAQRQSAAADAARPRWARRGWSSCATSCSRTW